jgi:hypothetical protein
MGEEVEVRRELERASGPIPDAVWEDLVTDGYVREHLDGTLEPDLTASWRTLKSEAGKRTRLVKRHEATVLGEERAKRRASSRDYKREGGKLEVNSFVGSKTKAMLGAMSEFFAGLANQHPEVVEFRNDVLGGILLSPDEAHELIASYAARIFDLRLFKKWDIPVLGHTSDIAEHYTGLDVVGIYVRAIVRVEPPGITRTVRYADPYNSLTEEDVADTRCEMQGNGAVIPLVRHLPIQSHGRYTYPSWLWPGSVVDKLYDLSEELADAFDWPASVVMEELGRPRNEAAAWFVLTGEAPAVRPFDARWSTKGGSAYLNPQWRIELTVPPWLPEEEVSRAYRLVKRQIRKGRNRLPDPKTVEVARFVWEQERRNEYKRPSWRSLLEKWNKEHPIATFKSYNNFRTVCMRGVKAVTELNFTWPQSGQASTSREQHRASPTDPRPTRLSPMAPPKRRG